MWALYKLMLQFKDGGHHKNNGFIGLVALLISILIICLIVWRSDLSIFEDKKQNTVESGLQAIDNARDAKNIIEQNLKKTATESQQ